MWIILKTVCGSVCELPVFDLLEMQLQNMVINWEFSASLQMTAGIALKSGEHEQRMQRMYLAAMTMITTIICSLAA